MQRCGICFFVVFLSSHLLLIVPKRNPERRNDSNTQVTLELTSVTARRLSSSFVRFDCEMVVINSLSKELTVHSLFQSAFDAMEIVIIDGNGKTICRQPYWYHQSFYSLNGAFKIKIGQNNGTLSFPIHGLPEQIRMCRVFIIGTFPGSKYDRVLCSNSVNVYIR